MSKNYQPDRNNFNPYDQSNQFGSGEQNQEYQDLYNPYKSVWNAALKGKPQHLAGATPAQQFRAKEHGLVYSERRPDRHYHKLHPRDMNYQYNALSPNTQNEFSAGQDTATSNTYRNQTTGYGPRD